MRRADARSAQIDRPNGVVRVFQIRLNKVEPLQSKLARNLLSKDNWRLALRDELEPCRPEMPLIIKAACKACRGERLARTAASPNFLIIGNICESERNRPAADAGKKMALGVGGEFIRLDIPDVTLVDVAWSDVGICDEVAQPPSAVWVDLIVVGKWLHCWNVARLL